MDESASYRRIPFRARQGGSVPGRGSECQECRQDDDHGEHRQCEQDQDSDELDPER
jgi:hypothetical protein